MLLIKIMKPFPPPFRPSLANSNADELLTEEPYGALSPSVQTRLSNSNINKKPAEEYSYALSLSFHFLSENIKFKHQKYSYDGQGTYPSVKAPQRTYLNAAPAKTSTANLYFNSIHPSGVSGPVDAFKY